MTLQRSLLLLLLGLLVGTVGVVMTITYITTRDSIVALRDDILDQVNNGVRYQMERYFNRAEPVIGYCEEVMRSTASGSEERGPARAMAQFLRTEPHFSWLYYGGAETGDLIGAARLPEGPIVLTICNETTQRRTLAYVEEEDGHLREVPIGDSPDAIYDSRTRPWYRLGAEAGGELVWTDPYQFANIKVLGVTATRALYEDEGKIKGILAADLLLDEMAAYLDSLKVGKSGAAFLLLPNGSYVTPDEQRRGENVLTLRRALSKHLPEGLTPGHASELHFRDKGEEYMAKLQPIPLPGHPGYFTAVVVPKRDFLAVVHRNKWIAWASTLAILILAAVLGVTFAKRITEPLALISGELEKIGQLHFPEHDVDLQSSIREISLFHDSLGKMKVSLRSFSRYVPRDLVRHLLAKGDEARLGGRVQLVTAAFCDLAGFTKLSETLPPDVVFEELREFLEVIARHQHQLGGITSNFTGDGTLALFNAPQSLDNHSERACRSALEAVAELGTMNQQRAEHGKPALQTRIGINTAQVLLGNVGTSERFAYTAVGDGVNLASRLEGLNKLYGTHILVGEDCYRLAKDAFVWRKVDRIAVVGREQPVVIYEPLGENSKVTETTLSVASQYQVGLSSYFEGDFTKAEAIFAEIQNDPASIVMQRRCQQLRKQRPEGQWSGVYSAPFK